MPRADVIFERVQRVPTQKDYRAGEIVLGEETVRLPEDEDRAAGYADLLRRLQEMRHPVYLEVDEARVLQRLLIPIVSQVESVEAATGELARQEGDLEVRLRDSHGRHVVRRDHPDYEDTAALLRRFAASDDTLAVAVDDGPEILAVKDFGPVVAGGAGGTGPGTVPASGKRRRCMTKRQAQELFDDLASRSCAPLTVPPPCIPFLYPDDGCWGRAHEMCRLMIDQGVQPKKVWIYGNLVTPTKNNPNCKVYWGWHVAPTACVRSGCLGGKQQMVFDPSLFDKPVSKATWKGVQGDAAASLEDSAWETFQRSQGGGWTSTDPTFASTNGVLNTYRMKLQARSLNIGPPPYANC